MSSTTTLWILIFTFINISLWLVGLYYKLLLARLKKKGLELDKEIAELDIILNNLNRKIEASKKGYDIKIFTQFCDETKFIATITHNEIFKDTDYTQN